VIARASVLACGAAVLGLLAGCGGNGDGNAKQDFITKANKICADGNAAVAGLTDEITKAARANDPSKVYKRVGELTKRAAAASTPYLNRLDALDAPGGDRDKIKQWILQVRRQQTLVGQLGEAFAKRDNPKIASLSERIDKLDQTNNRFARSYGMSECAKSVRNKQ
jgi:hypothetical protein